MWAYYVSRFKRDGCFDYAQISARALEFFTNQRIIIVCGATGTGKSQIALHIAKKLKNKAVIINADSMQIYKEVPIITSQPTKSEMEHIPHVLYGILPCQKKFSVGKWLSLTMQEIKQAEREGNIPILVGGSGLYIKVLMEGLANIPLISQSTEETIRLMSTTLSTIELYSKLTEVDALYAAKISPSDKQRILRALAVFVETGDPISNFHAKSPLENDHPFKRGDFYVFYANPLRQIIYRNINNRFINMLTNGLVEEIQALINGASTYPKILGLKQIIDYISGAIELSTAINKAQQATRNYVKRQLTWFGNQIKPDFILR